MSEAPLLSPEKREKAIEFLSHYASPYYDPVKAHEYYERTKKLKGRQPKKLSEKSRKKITEGLVYARNQISTKREAERNALIASQKAKLEKLQKDAEANRDKIINQVREAVAQIKKDVQAVEGNVIPKNATPRQRAFLEAQNRAIKARAAKAGSKDIQTAQGKANDQIRKVGTDLKDAVSKAQASYQAGMKAISDKYAKALKTETANITKKVR